MVAVVLVGAAFLASIGSVSRPGVGPQSDAAVGVGTQSSAFYCAGLEHLPGVVSSTVAIADLASTPRLVEVTTTDQDEQVALREVHVAPGQVVHLQPGNFLSGTVEAVSVASSGGDIAVTEAVRGLNGVSVAPCLSVASTSWWVTGGSTEPNQSFVVSVYNPYASRAVASVTLTTPSGVLPPSSYGGLVLGAYQLDALVVHDVAPNEAPITAHVVASVGDVVVDGLQRGTKAQTAVALLPGTPGPSRQMVLPIATSRTSFTTSLLLVATTKAPVTATVAVLAPAGCTLRCPAPFVVSVPGGGAATSLTVSPSSRVPLDEPLAVVVHATAPGIVLAEGVSTSGAQGATVPLFDPDLAGARRLVLVNPLSSGFSELGIVNPTGHNVTVTMGTVTASGPQAFGSTVVVRPHTNLVVPESDLRGTVGGVLVLTATGPISAAGVVRDATIGSSTLVGAPE
jgi:hypothetical protein